MAAAILTTRSLFAPIRGPTTVKRARMSAVVTALLGSLTAQMSHGDVRGCGDSQAKEIIDLGEPQVDPVALQRVRERHSDHYANIIGVMERFLSLVPPFDPAGAERRYGAREICTEQIVPTLPPKIVLQFTMDDFRYRVTLRRVAQPMPDRALSLLTMLPLDSRSQSAEPCSLYRWKRLGR